MLGGGGWRSGLIWPVANADGRERVDRSHEAEGLRRFGERRSVGKAEAAIVTMRELLGTVGAVLLADELRAFGRAQDCERTARHAAAHQRGVGERLQEIERDRKQRHGQNRRAPALVGAFADHGLF